MGDYYGYVILAIFAVIFIGISIFVSKKFPIEGVDDFVAAGRGIPSSLVAASVMVSWVWTTTIMGSAEAGMSFGISGGLNYSWGNSIPLFRSDSPGAASEKKDAQVHNLYRVHYPALWGGGF